MTSVSGPDIRQLREQSLPRADFPGGRSQAFRVALEPAVHAEIWKHGTQDTSVEICGVLVGTLSQDSTGPFLHVSASIRGEAASNKFAEVTFTHETWNRINQEMDTKYADRSIVGWYHTHPNFGIFLSDRDQFICQHFFSGPGQIAHVVDPIRKLEGVFIWENGKTRPLPWFWVGDRLLASASDNSGEMSTPAQSPAVTQIVPRDAEPVTPWWIQAMLITSVFLVGWLLHGMLSTTNRDLERQHGFYVGLMQYGLRPGLGGQLREVREDLRIAARNLDLISEDHLRRLETAKASEADRTLASAAWNQTLGRLKATERVVSELETLYALTPDQERELIGLLESQRRRQPPEIVPEKKATSEKKASPKTEPKSTTKSGSPKTKETENAEPAKPSVKKESVKPKSN